MYYVFLKKVHMIIFLISIFKIMIKKPLKLVACDVILTNRVRCGVVSFVIFFFLGNEGS